MSLEGPIIIVTFVLATYFLLRWLLAPLFTNEKTRNWVSAVGAMFLGPTIYFALGFILLSYLFHVPQHDFDREEWFEDKHTRFEMRDDIINSKILNGKSESEIISFIGKPERIDSTHIWEYDLGTSGAGLGFQFNYLELIFKDGRVVEVRKIEIVD